MAKQLKGAGVPLPEILEVLSAVEPGQEGEVPADSAPSDDSGVLVIEPLTWEEDRRLTEELRQALAVSEDSTVAR